jgi:hypothetical protein
MSSMVVAPVLAQLLLGCRGAPDSPVPGDVIIAFQSRAEGEIEPCG